MDGFMAIDAPDMGPQGLQNPQKSGTDFFSEIIIENLVVDEHALARCLLPVWVLFVHPGA